MKSEYQDFIKPVKYWDSLKTVEQLTEAFQDNTLKIFLANNKEDFLEKFYKDQEFATAAEKLEKAAKQTIKVLKEIRSKLPYRNKECEEKARANINVMLSSVNEEPRSIAIYTDVLLIALQEHYIKKINSGFSIPEIRAAKRAYHRYLTLKKEKERRRVEFEKTQEYRTQAIEVKLGIRDHIEYPE